MDECCCVKAIKHLADALDQCCGSTEGDCPGDGTGECCKCALAIKAAIQCCLDCCVP